MGAPRSLATALTLLLALAAGPLVTPAHGVETSAPAGAPGIGDPYFPLDGNGGIDVLSYDVHDRYDLATQRLSGWTALRLRATASVSSFDLDFLLPVRSVRVDGVDTAFTRRPHELVVARRLTRGDVVGVRVRYAGQPDRHSYAGESNWLANAGEVVAMNQPHMAPWWFPSNDHPLDKATMRISITVPQRYVVVANGRQVRRTEADGLATTTWRADEPMVPYLAFFAAGRFRVASGTSGGLPWLVAVSERLGTAEQRTAMDLMRRTPALVAWLQGVLGPYPFSTVGGVTTSLNAGFALENQTRPTYPYLGGGAGAVATVVHELAHQWLGDSVAVSAWRDIWLNEGAATYAEWLYDETHGGQTVAHRLRSEYAAIAADDPWWAHEVADPCPTHLRCIDSIFAGFVYDRGAMALAALRSRIGDAAFGQLLRRWVAERAGGNGSTADFESLASEVSGADLSGFFTAWLHTASKPAATADNGLAQPST